VVARKFERLDLRSFGDFLQMELYRDNSSDGFNSCRGRSFEGPQNTDGGSSLHFVENFHMI